MIGFVLFIVALQYKIVLKFHAKKNKNN